MSTFKDLGTTSTSFVKQFKDFISRGNVIDLAVGIIIGGAFQGIVTSLVNDIIMPPISYLLSGVDVKSWKLDISHPLDGKPIVSIAYGNFLQASLNFLIIAFVIFLVIKGINSLKRHEEEKGAPPPEPSAEEKLLTEIRDLLKNRPV